MTDFTESYRVLNRAGAPVEHITALIDSHIEGLRTIIADKGTAQLPPIDIIEGTSEFHEAIKQLEALKVEINPNVSLGKRLAAQLRSRTDEQNAREALKTEHDQKEFNRQADRVRSFFAELQEDTIEAIELGRKVPVRRLPKTGPLHAYDERKLVNRKDHTFYFVFKEFELWAAGNDLKWDFAYGHDGMGMESWFNVSLVPA